MNGTLQGKENCGPVILQLVGELRYVVCRVRCTFLNGYRFYSFEVWHICGWWFCVPADIPLCSLVLVLNIFKGKLDFCLTVHHQLGKVIEMNQLDATMIY